MKNPEPKATVSELHEANRLVGTVLAGRYEVTALIGVGAMASVFLAHHVAIRKRLAVKVLHASMLQVPEMVARFEREALAAAHVEHPNVAAAHDFGRTADGGFFLALDYIDGIELRRVLQQGPLSVARTVAIARQITSALIVSHELKIIHRDLKPENIMLTQREGQPEFVKILDFGLAKVPAELRMHAGTATAPATPSPQLTKIGALYGTPGYMAPEQAMSEAVDGRCDLYSLGAILYEMLTGRPPFDGNTVLELIDEHLTTPLPQMRQRAPSVFIPEPVEAIVRRLLAKRPEDRFPGARELQTALEQIVVPSPVPPPVPPPVAPPPTIQPPSAASAPAAPVPDPASLPSPGLARRGTVVALERPPGSFGYQLGQLHKSLPAPLSKVPLPLLLGMLLIFLVVMMVVPWLVR